MATSILDNNYLQGTAEFADAYARAVKDRDLSKAYDFVLKGIEDFGAHSVVVKLANDLQVRRAKAQAPPQDEKKE